MHSRPSTASLWFSPTAVGSFLIGAVVALVLGLALFSCSSDPGSAPTIGTSSSSSTGGGVDGAAAGLLSLSLDPPSAALDLAYGKVATVSFKALGHFVDGSDRDLTT